MMQLLMAILIGSYSCRSTPKQDASNEINASNLNSIDNFESNENYNDYNNNNYTNNLNYYDNDDDQYANLEWDDNFNSFNDSSLFNNGSEGASVGWNSAFPATDEQPSYNDLIAESLGEEPVVENFTNPSGLSLDASPPIFDTPSPTDAVEEGLTAESTTQVIVAESTRLWWIGYDFDIRSRMLHVHLVCQGTPQLGFALSPVGQGRHELVIQMADTTISRRIRRKVNASEFPAPVSWIRSEAHGLDAHVILTLREALEPEVYQDGGHLKLSFPLGDRYLAMAKDRKVPVRNIEVLFADASPLLDEPIEAKMDNRAVFRPDTQMHTLGRMASRLDLSETFSNKLNDPSREEIPQVEPVIETPLQYDPQGSVVFARSVLGVAQDDFNYDAWWSEGESNSANPLMEPVAETETITGQEDAYRIENYNGKPIQLEFHQAPLSQVLRAISSQIKTNFVYPTDVGEIRVSVRLSGVAWDAALSAILQTNRLGMSEVSSNVIRVDRIERMSEYLGLKQRSDEATKLTVPPKVLVSRLSYTRAEDMARIIETFVRSTVAPDSMRVSFSARSNTLIVEAPPSVLSRTKAIIEKVDVPTPQVEIASRLVEVFNSAANFLGISWGGMHNFDANRASGSGALAFPNSMNSAFSIDPGVTGDARAGSVAINLGSINDFLNIDLRLRMEELKGRTEILQSSRIIVADRERGSISSGKSLYLQRSSQGGVVIASGEAASGQAGASGIDEINFDLSLEVTPEITNNGFIFLELNLQSSNADDSSGAAVAASSNRSLNTRLKKKDGQTAVIGGIYDTSKRESVIGVPFLSSLPLIGPLFRSKSYNESQTEMMIFITPKIINPESINSEFSYETKDSPPVASSMTTPVQNINQWNNSGNYDNYNNNNADFNNYNQSYNFEDNYESTF